MTTTTGNYDAGDFVRGAFINKEDLADGPVPSDEVLQAGKASGLSSRG